MRQGKQNNYEGGFVLVDAMVGMIITSLMIAVCLVAVNITRQQAQSATDSRAAQALLIALIETTPHAPGDYNGKSAGMTYAVGVSKDTYNNMDLCQLDARVQAPKRNHIYRLSATRWCARQTS